MTIEEIIEMARQIFDIDVDRRGRETFVCDEYGLAAFAKLVEEKVIRDQHEFIKRFNGDAENLLREKGWHK